MTSTKKVITVRIDPADHRELIAQARERDVSLNRLAVSRLLRPADEPPVKICRYCGRRPTACRCATNTNA